MTATSTAQERSSTGSVSRKAPLWATLAGTFFYIGNMKPGPGTWASVATMLLWRGFGGLLPAAWQTPGAALAAVAVTAVGIPAATRVARAVGKEDPSQVVIDEVAGQMIAMIGAPLAWKPLLAALVLFRLFDITKPTPLRRLEHLPEGTGIMLDDVGAGLYALAIMQLLLHFGVLR
jgi:phosphatidylglycerophosphatase A